MKVTYDLAKQFLESRGTDLVNGFTSAEIDQLLSILGWAALRLTTSRGDNLRRAWDGFSDDDRLNLRGIGSHVKNNTLSDHDVLARLMVEEAR